MDNKTDLSSILWIRFEGEKLDQQSIPIYDLAQVFIAVQRIVNKTYLYNENRLLKGERLTQSEQELVSLQLKERQKGSDMYGLSSFLEDPFVTNIIIPIILEGLVALSAYAYKKVLQKDKKVSSKAQEAKPDSSGNAANKADEAEKKQAFSGLIYPQVNDIVTRIDGASGIRVIEIYPQGQDISPFQFDGTTKEYVKQIKNEYFLGEMRTIKGTLQSLYPSNNAVVIRRGPNDFVKAYVKENDFELIRYEARKNTVITLTGRPMHKFGIETAEFSEFETYSVKLEKSKSKTT